MRTRHAAAALAATFALAGCTANVDTALDVTSPTDAALSVAATFTGEAADAIIEDAATKDELVKTFTARTGSEPDIDTDAKDHRVTVSTTLPYAKATELSGITGVKSVNLAAKGETDTATTTVTLTGAPDLVTAMTAATANEQDGQALSQTMAQSTTVTTTIRYGGDIETVDHTGALTQGQVTHDGDTVVVTRDVDTAKAATVTVTGDTTGFPVPYPITALAALLLAAGATRTGYGRWRDRQPITAAAATLVVTGGAFAAATYWLY